jgi:hypothetical protein
MTPAVVRPVAATVVVGIAVTCGLLLSGCSTDDLQGGKVHYSSYPPVSMLPPSSPGSPVVPAAFPAEIPVVKGLYSLRSGAGGTQVLTVTGITPDALVDARKLFIDAGFEPQTFVGQEAFMNTRYLVLLGSEDLPDSFTLTYTVTTMSMPGIGSIPTSIPKLF